MREQHFLVMTAGIVAALLGAGGIAMATMGTRLCGKPLPGCQRTQTVQVLCAELHQYICSSPYPVSRSPFPIGRSVVSNPSNLGPGIKTS